MIELSPLKHGTDCSGSKNMWLGRGVKRSVSIRQFILALGLYTPEEMNNNLFEPFRDACFRNRPNNYNPTEYFVRISTRNHYDTRHPPSYTMIKNPIRRLVHSMDGGDMVDVPCTVAKFLSEKAKGYKKKSLIVGSHLIGRIVRSYGLMALALISTDKTKITRKPSKTSKHGHEERKSVQEPEAKVRKVNIGQLSKSTLEDKKPKVTNLVPQVSKVTQMVLKLQNGP
ncbi:hypothetical protein Tco_0725131 [Tanacetum coccineum]|uniref:Uncharacterized protein n=1 Tax=Tanacetum coccineum TaxID=301880 RepID=A0ABQ4YE76_9ASTR